MSDAAASPPGSADRPLDAQVRFELRDDGVAQITLDRPEVKNAISPAQRDRLTELFSHASENLAVRAVVLTATGDAFCTGADLRASQEDSPKPADAPERPTGHVARMIRRGAQRLVASVLDCEKPVVAAVNGTAAGIGAHLALACDLVLVAEGARFIEVFARRGLVPDGGGAYLLGRLVGLHVAKELTFFGDDVSADDAVRLGLANRAVPADELATTADQWATRLAAGPTQALRLTKALLNRSLDVDRTTAFDQEATAQELNMGTHDANEGVAAFVERRQPNYRGW